MRIKGIYGFACILLHLGPLLDGQSRQVYEKKKWLWNCLFSSFHTWSSKSNYSLAFFSYFKFFLKKKDDIFDQKVSAIFFKEKYEKNLSLSKSFFLIFSSIPVRKWWHTDWSANQCIGLCGCELDRKQSNLTFMTHFLQFLSIFTTNSIFFSEWASPRP